MALLSIVIPCWNAADYISGMMDCLLKQTFHDWQAFIVDDCSLDDSQKIVSNYHNKDGRINLVIRDRGPKGAQTCRNIGIERAILSKYVILFDADDYVTPYCFQQRVDYMEKHPEYDFGVFPARGYENDINEPEIHFVWGYHFFEDNLKALIDGTLPMVGWTNIYRTASLLSKQMSWDERILSLQDSDWNIQSIIKGLQFGFAVEEGAQMDYYYKRSTLNSVANKINSAEHIENHFILVDKVYNSLSDLQREKYRLTLSSKYVCFMEQAILVGVNINRLVEDSCFYKQNLLFRLRFSLLRLFKFRGFRFLYKKELQYIGNVNRIWRQKIDELCYSRLRRGAIV